MRYFLHALLVSSAIAMPLAASAKDEAPAAAKAESDATHDVGCIPVDQAKNEYTPADLFPAVAACIKQGKTGDAADLYVLASIYGAYDKQRVEDLTARSRESVLEMKTIGALDAKTKGAFDKAVHARTGSAKGGKDLCGKIQTIGQPSYAPDYLTKHAKQDVQYKQKLAEANLKHADKSKADEQAQEDTHGLVDGFNGDAAWKATLAQYLHCGE